MKSSRTEQSPGLDPVVADVLRRTGALQTGHFKLTSGLHSAQYFQAMRLLEQPKFAHMAASAAAAHFENLRVDVAFAPAIGGIPWGFVLAEHFPGSRAVFAERVDGSMKLRRGFTIGPGERVLLAEDVTTTGGSVMELKKIAEELGGEVMGVAMLFDRSGGRFRPGVDHFSWARMEIETWKAEDCPLCREGDSPESLGSRETG